MHIIKKIIPGCVFIALLLLSGCKSEPTTETAPPERKKVTVPRFEKDSAYHYVEQQLAFGPRVPNSEAHQQCKDWLVSKFKGFGADVIEQDFQADAYTGEKLDGTNIIAQFNPKSSRRILLAAHWDSRHIADSPLSTERQAEPILGADDGGSGVGVLLEVARQLQANPIELGVDIVLFDLEDYGESGSDNANSWALGSQYWSRNLHVRGYRPEYGILLDMVGSKGARFTKEKFSMDAAPNVVNKVWKLAQNMGYGNHFINENGGGVTDDHYFVITIARIPMIDIINRPIGSQTGFGDYWHTHNDDIDVIDKNTLRSVGQVMLAVVYREDGGIF